VYVAQVNSCGRKPVRTVVFAAELEGWRDWLARGRKESSTLSRPVRWPAIRLGRHSDPAPACGQCRKHEKREKERCAVHPSGRRPCMFS
jgi:hypothetical protein